MADLSTLSATQQLTETRTDVTTMIKEFNDLVADENVDIEDKVAMLQMSLPLVLRNLNRQDRRVFEASMTTWMGMLQQKIDANMAETQALADAERASRAYQTWKITLKAQPKSRRAKWIAANPAPIM